MKVLFVGLPLRGHFNPTLPLVRELVRRGHEVAYYSGSQFAPEIKSAGARAGMYQDAFLTELGQLPPNTDEVSWLLMRTAAGVLRTQLNAFRAEAPDLVIADSVAPWGQWIGRILGVPVVTSITTFAFNRHVLAYAAGRGIRPRGPRRVLSKVRHVARAWRLRRELCREFGVDGPGVIASVMGSSDLNIVYTSRHFQPRSETFDDRFLFVGPMTERADTAAFPWEQLRGSEVVYVSLGTVFNTDEAFYRSCFEAFADCDFQVILSTGGAVRLEALGRVPSNFIVSPRVPQLAVLQRVRAFVTHGGMNSVSESLALGVPMVVIPQMGEQEAVARRVEHLGAGVYLDREHLTAERLRQSVQTVLGDGRFRNEVAVIRRSFAEAGGVARAADAIELFKSARAPSTADSVEPRPGPG